MRVVNCLCGATIEAADEAAHGRRVLGAHRRQHGDIKITEARRKDVD